MAIMNINFSLLENKLFAPTLKGKGLTKNLNMNTGM
jgi:hypothetical protein